MRPPPVLVNVLFVPETCPARNALAGWATQSPSTRMVASPSRLMAGNAAELFGAEEPFQEFNPHRVLALLPGTAYSAPWVPPTPAPLKVRSLLLTWMSAIA